MEPVRSSVHEVPGGCLESEVNWKRKRLQNAMSFVANTDVAGWDRRKHAKEEFRLWGARIWLSLSSVEVAVSRSEVKLVQARLPTSTTASQTCGAQLPNAAEKGARMSAVLLKGIHVSEFRRSSVGDLNGPISPSTVIFQLRRWSESQL
jgi:hypothetical protein